MTARFRRDGAGFTFELRDERGKVVHTGWCAGSRRDVRLAIKEIELAEAAKGGRP